MEKFILIFLISLFSIAIANPNDLNHLNGVSEYKKTLILLLPEKIQSLKIGQDTKATIESKLGRPDLIDKEKIYYALNGFKYSLELIFEKDILKQYTYIFSKDRPTTKKLPFNPKDYVLTKKGAFAKKGYYEVDKKDITLIADSVTEKIFMIRFKE